MKSNNNAKRSQGSRPAKKTVKTQSKSQPRRKNPRVRESVRNAPVGIAVTSTQVGPARISGKGDHLVVCHSEFIRNVSGDVGGFVIYDRLRVNPGSSKSFNWLSRIALNYEFYRFRKLALRYEPRCATSTAGVTITSYDYDASDNPNLAPNEQALYNNVGTVDTSVWMRHINPMRTELANRAYKAHSVMSDSRFDGTSQDEKTIDAAQVVLARDTASSFSAGKLFFDYEVELWGPQQVTESPEEGGAALAGGGAAATGKPITSIVTLVQEANPVLKGAAQLNQTFPTAIIGQLTKDWEGVINTTLGGTGLGGTGGPKVYVRPGVNPASDSAGQPWDVLQGILNSINFRNAGDTLAVSSNRVEGKAGDYVLLDTQSISAASVSGITAQLGGSSAF